MKTLLALFLSGILLAGCGGQSSVKSSFPDVPPKLMDPPAALKTIKPIPSDTKPNDEAPSGVMLSAVTKIITDNYTTCNIYREQIFGLQSWITEQKKLNK